jgi:PAS domain S-box-containing protein
MKKFSVEFWSWIVSLAAIVTIIALLAFGMSAVERFRQVNEQWRAHNVKITATTEALTRLRGSIGYGGFIHNFKNYVLRRSATYQVRVENDIRHTENILNQYHKIHYAEAEHAALLTIQAVLTDYFDKFSMVKRMIAEGRSSTDIDAAVKIDDKPALEAFDILIALNAAQSRTMEAQTDADLRSAVRFLSIGTLVAILIAGVALLVVVFIRKIIDINKKLTSANNHINLLFDTAPDAMICVRPDGVIVKSNQQAEVLFGYKESEFIGMPIEDLMPEAFREKHTQLRAGFFRSPSFRPIGMGLDLTALTKDGRVPLVEISLSHSGADEEPLATITVRDITERKALEEQLRQSQKMEVVGHLAGGVAHDFNNLLAVMIGNAEILQDQAGLDERARRSVEALIKAVDRSADLTQRLLAFSRQQDLLSKPTAINDLVLGLEEVLKPTLGEAVELRTHLQSGTCEAQIDPHQFENALVNLAINAQYAMPNGGVLTIETDNVTLDEAYTEQHEEVTPGDYVKVTMSDTGVGMTPETLENVFEPFYTTKEVGEGSGLGLSMVYGFIKQSKGHIAIRSKVDHGTTVELYLPRCTKTPVQEGV